MKFLFLDVDGVLNTDGVLELSWLLGNKSNALCPHRIRLVSQIIQETGAEVVISSDWRLDEHKPALDILRAALCMWAIPIYSSTPDLSVTGYRPARWQEIEAWMNLCDEDIDNLDVVRQDAAVQMSRQPNVELVVDTAYDADAASSSKHDPQTEKLLLLKKTMVCRVSPCRC